MSEVEHDHTAFKVMTPANNWNAKKEREIIQLKHRTPCLSYAYIWHKKNSDCTKGINMYMGIFSGA